VLIAITQTSALLTAGEDRWVPEREASGRTEAAASSSSEVLQAFGTYDS
jgi:hypothetical protein